MKFAITSAPTTPPVAPPGKSVFNLNQQVKGGLTSCFPTTGFNITPGTYGFSYTVANNVVVTVGDDSSGPNYFSGQGSGSGTMYLDFSGSSLSICASNISGGDTSLDFTITQ